MPSNLEYIYNLVIKKILSTDPVRKTRNLSNDLYAAIESLRSNDNIV